MGNQARKRARRWLRVPLRIGREVVGHVSIDATKLSAAVIQRAAGDGALARAAMHHLRWRAEEAAADALAATIDDAVAMSALKPTLPWLRDREIAALALKVLQKESAIAHVNAGNDSFDYPAAASSQRWRTLQIRFVQRGIGHILTRGTEAERAALHALFRPPSHRSSRAHGGREYVEEHGWWFLDALRSALAVSPSKRWTWLESRHPEVAAAWQATKRSAEHLRDLTPDDLKEERGVELGAALACANAGYKPE